MHRLSYLKIHGPVFDLKNNIIPELAIQTDKIVITGSCPVCLSVSPVLLAVVNKASPNDQTSIGLDRLCQHIGSLGMGSSVSKGPWPSF